MLALVVFGYAASAQSLKVTSAREAENRGYYDKAKKLIDEACANEQTINDAKTWYFAGLIYSRIGEESTKQRSKYKNLDPDWLTKCKDAALRCKELDTEKEYVEGNNAILSFVGNQYYTQAIPVFNRHSWDSCMALCEESIKLFNLSGHQDYAAESYLLAGRAAKYANNNEAVLKYFKPLVRTKTKKAEVYQTLFSLYKSTKDTNEALKVAQNFVKNCQDDYNANMMMAEAYMMKGNLEQGNVEIQNALSKTTDKPELHAQVLAIAGATLENVGNIDGAEARYKESLGINSNQFFANYGLGIITFNKVVDKIQNIPFDDETGLLEQTKPEYANAIPYLQAAIDYVKGLDQAGRDANRQNLYNALNALRKVFATLERYDEANAITTEINSLTQSAQITTEVNSLTQSAQ